MTHAQNLKKIVVKFGGSNLKRKEDIGRLIQAVKYYDRPIVIVVSALYGVTDLLDRALHRVAVSAEAIQQIKEELVETHRQVAELYLENSTYCDDVVQRIRQRVEQLEKYLQGIHCIGEIPDFVKDRILSYGERLSSLLLSSILAEQDFPCCECLPEDLGLVTNGEFGNARVDFSLSQKVVKEYLSGDRLYIVPGFYGISTDGKVTLLGRGGSDYTAAAIAYCIDAESVDLWKDVPGYLSADPKSVDSPAVIHRLTYNEAAELSYFGARIAHPRTFEPAEEKNIPVRLFNINHFSESLTPVTLIDDQQFIKEDVVKSVTFSDDFGVLKLHGAGVGIKPGILAKVTSRLNENRINIKSVITTQTTINILLSRSDLLKGLQEVESCTLSAVDRISAHDNVSLIAAVGEGILERPGIAARVLSAVSAHGINVWSISAGASDVAIYFIIDRDKRDVAVQAIHETFFGARRDAVSVDAEDYRSYEASLGYVV